MIERNPCSISVDPLFEAQFYTIHVRILHDCTILIHIYIYIHIICVKHGLYLPNSPHLQLLEDALLVLMVLTQILMASQQRHLMLLQGGGHLRANGVRW